MIKYQDVVEYLHGEGCQEVEGSEMPENPPLPATVLFRNCINSHTCQVCKEPSSVTAFCHIVYELKIDPPPYLYDDYAIYSPWREGMNKFVEEDALKEKKEK